MYFKKYINTWWGKLIFNLILLFIVSGFLMLIVSLYLKSYTRHGKNILTPAFIGLPLNKAEQIAQKYDLKLKIIDSVYTGFQPPGTVIDQTPPVNFKIKKGRTIFITIKAFTLRSVKMPNLVNLSLIQAKSILETKGLRIGQIKYRNGFKNLVLEQILNGKHIKTGTPVPVGTMVDLIVGKGYEEDNKGTVVPDLQGFTLDNAKFLAAENSLNIAPVHYTEQIKTRIDTLTAVVIKQAPTPNTKTTIGQSIEVWLGKQ